jgi:hypothetical protein
VAADEEAIAEVIDLLEATEIDVVAAGEAAAADGGRRRGSSGRH